MLFLLVLFTLWMPLLYLSHLKMALDFIILLSLKRDGYSFNTVKINYIAFSEFEFCIRPLSLPLSK